LQPKCFESIDDLPILNWFEIINKDDYSWLFIDRPINPCSPLNSKVLFRSLYNQYLERFVIGKSNDIKEKEIEIALLKSELLLTKNSYLKTLIQIEQLELDSLQNSLADTKSTLDEDILAIELGLNRPVLDPRTLPTSKFYIYVEGLKKKVEQVKKGAA